MHWHLGTMGFGYKQWVGAFYPAGMASRNFLAHYARRFDAVEIDSTFYGIPRPELVQRWTAVTPPHFTFCLKTPKAITHEAPLAQGHETMQQFLETISLLQEKLGVVLVQFGPEFTFAQAETLDAFLAGLPTDKRYAVEFRHRSWEREETAALLQQHNACWVAADYIHLDKTIWRTTDFLYLRFIGVHGQYVTKDKELTDKTAELKQWQAKIEPHLPHVNAVYGFFNNDYAGYSPATCNRFKRILELETKEIRPLVQGRLF